MAKAQTLEMAKQMLAEARADIAQADHKASILLATLGVGFAAILGGQQAGGFDASSLTFAGQVAWWLGASVAVMSVGSAALAVWPRYKTGDMTDGITYWGHVASYDKLDALVNALDAQGPADARRTIHQLWRISRVVKAKYFWVRFALTEAAVSGVLLILAVLVLR